MNKFLEITHKALAGIMKYDKIHVVMGNESCDLDSAISSLVYAFHLYKKSFTTDTKTVVIPVLNITADEYPLKTETKYFLKKHNICSSNLIFRNHLDLAGINKCNKLRLTLVDHHLLPENDSYLIDSLKEVIDHRPVDPKISTNLTSKVIEQVGSCCTLVANIILKENPDILTIDLASLLHGTIILDTVNFNKDANRFKDLDITVVEKLESLFKIEECRENIHNELIKARSDISDMSPLQVLQKDMKIVNGVPIPGVPMLFREFINITGADAALKQMCVKYESNILVPMGLTKKDENVLRDIAIFATESCPMQLKLSNTLKSNSSLGLEEVPTVVDGLILFKQNNIKMSRKHIIPILKTVLEQEN